MSTIGVLLIIWGNFGKPRRFVYNLWFRFRHRKIVLPGKQRIEMVATPPSYMMFTEENEMDKDLFDLKAIVLNGIQIKRFGTGYLGYTEDNQLCLVSDSLEGAFKIAINETLGKGMIRLLDDDIGTGFTIDYDKAEEPDV